MVRVRLARGGNSRENSPHYREAKKSTNVRDEIEKSFESKIRIFNATLAGSTSRCLCFYMSKQTAALLVTGGAMKNVEGYGRIDLMGLFGQPF